MLKKRLFIAILFTSGVLGAMVNGADAGKLVPLNLFNIGDSIGEGEAAYGTVRNMNHDVVWSTGYDPDDVVYSLNERFEDACQKRYYENNSNRDITFNRAVSGSVMAAFTAQADEVVDMASASLSGKAGMVTILLGNNDVCASSTETMTPPDQFEAQYRAGLDVLAASDSTRNAYIHVSSIPAIYWMWNAMQERLNCRLAWLAVPCQNLLANPDNDCGNGDSHLDPDNIHYDDGPNCRRRKAFHAKIRDIYNPILRDVLQEYIDDRRLPNAYFVDVFDVQFEAIYINEGDCFHPSARGHAVFAEAEWGRSPWGTGALSCTSGLVPGIFLLLMRER